MKYLKKNVPRCYELISTSTEDRARQQRHPNKSRRKGCAWKMLQDRYTQKPADNLIIDENINQVIALRIMAQIQSVLLVAMLIT